MTIIVPIVFASVLIGIFAKKMTGPLWMVLCIVIAASIAVFYLNH